MEILLLVKKSSIGYSFKIDSISKFKLEMYSNIASKFFLTHPHIFFKGYI